MGNRMVLTIEFTPGIKGLAGIKGLRNKTSLKTVLYDLELLAVLYI